jgi:hypothetical protein
MKPGTLSKEMTHALAEYARQVPEQLQERFWHEAASFLRPILQPGPEHVARANEFARVRLELPLETEHTKAAARAARLKQKADKEKREEWHREHSRKEFNIGLAPQYGRETARDLQRKYASRRREYDDA